jgi:hypothetical protein
VAEEFGVVFGGEIIAEGRSLFSAILQKNSDGINHANDEDKGADEEQGIHEVDHKCSPLHGISATDRKRACRQRVE